MATKPVAKLSRQERLARMTEKLRNTDTGGGGGAGFWSAKEGKSVIRILPEIGDMPFFFQTVGKHNFPPDGKKSCYCPKFTSEGELPCPVCEMVDDLYKSGSPENKELAGQLKVRKMYWMNIIVRGPIDPKTKERGPNSGPFIYTPGVKVFNFISNIIQDPDYGDILDVNDGIDLTIKREGTGFDTDYDVTPRRNSSPLSDDPEEAEKFLSEARDLSFVEATDDPSEDKEISKGHAVYVLPYDRIIRELELEDGFGAEEDDDDTVVVDDDEDVEEETPRTAVKSSRKSAKKEEVVEEEDDDTVFEDDEEEEEPVKKPVKSAKQEVERRLARRARR